MKKIMISAALLLSLASCVEEGSYDTVIVPPSDGDGRVSCVLSFGGAVELDTKSILGDGADAKSSGGVLAVYNSVTGKIDSEWDVKDFSKPLSLDLPCASPLDFYVVGNMWNIASDGSLRRVSFPEKESDVEKMTYRMDGSAVSGGRTETFAEAAKYGIPAAGVRKGVDIAKTSSVAIEMRRLFAKVTLTIDHSGLDGGQNPDYFKNVNLYLRQANILLSPFGAASKPLASGDVVTQSDYDASMTNGHSLTYTFYAPENRHSAFPTFIEFSGKVDSSAGGYGGSVCYKFYIGSGAENDYDVQRNQNYRIGLGFKVGSLFDPDWQVTIGDDWSDNRAFGLSADQAGSRRLGKGQVIAVRKSRDANCWVYFNRKGSGANEASLLEACDGAYSPSDLTKGAWWCEAPDLAKYGITLVNSSGKLTFHVTDPTKFVPGVKIPLKMHLYPGDIVSEAELTTYDDIKVTVGAGQSLSDEFYIGMKRSVSVSGLAGSKVYYWNSLGIDRLTLKPSTAPGTDWIHNKRSESQTFASDGTLDLCAYAYSGGQQFLLTLASDDTFNDGDVLMKETVVVHQLKMSTDTETVYLPFDGRDVDLPFYYRDSAGEVIPYEKFDKDIYGQILVPAVNWPDVSGASLSNWVASDGLKIWLDAYKPAAGSIVDRASSSSGLVGILKLGPKDKTIASGITSVTVFVRPPVMGRGFNDLTSWYFNTDGPSEITNDADLLLFDDSPYEVVISGENSSDVTVAVTPAAANYNGVRWKFSDAGRVPDGLAPIGRQKVAFVFTNRHSGEKYSLEYSFFLCHEVTLRPFTLFTVGARNAQVLATTAKNAWLLKRYCAGESIPRLTSFLGATGAAFSQFVTMQYPSAVKKGKSEVQTVNGVSLTGYRYEDFNSSAYGKNYTWTAARIKEFEQSGMSPLVNIQFTAPQTAPAVPNVGYLFMSASNSTLGCGTL